MLLFLIRIYAVRCGKSEMTRCKLIKKINGRILSFTWKANDEVDERCFKAEIYESGFAVSEARFFFVIVHCQRAFTHYTNLQPHLTAFSWESFTPHLQVFENPPKLRQSSGKIVSAQLYANNKLAREIQKSCLRTETFKPVFKSLVLREHFSSRCGHCNLGLCLQILGVYTFIRGKSSLFIVVVGFVQQRRHFFTTFLKNEVLMLKFHKLNQICSLEYLFDYFKTFHHFRTQTLNFDPNDASSALTLADTFVCIIKNRFSLSNLIILNLNRRLTLRCNRICNHYLIEMFIRWNHRVIRTFLFAVSWASRECPKSSQLQKLSQSAGGTREKLQKLLWNIPL